MTNSPGGFADGNTDTLGVGYDLIARFGTPIIEVLTNLGLTGSIFWEYYLSVDRDINKVRYGLDDGTATEWLHAYYEGKIELFVTFGRNREDPDDFEHMDHLQRYLTEYARHHPEQAQALADKYNIEFTTLTAA